MTLLETLAPVPLSCLFQKAAFGCFWYIAISPKLVIYWAHPITESLVTNQECNELLCLRLIHERVPKRSCSASVSTLRSPPSERQSALRGRALGRLPGPGGGPMGPGFALCSGGCSAAPLSIQNATAQCGFQGLGSCFRGRDALVGTPAVINLYAYMTCSLRMDRNSATDCAPGPVFSDFLIFAHFGLSAPL